MTGSIISEATKVPSASPKQVALSQKGAFLLSLHPQIYIDLAGSSSENLSGLKEEPTWLESQKGAYLLIPQEHQK